MTTWAGIVNVNDAGDVAVVLVVVGDMAVVIDGHHRRR